MLPMADRAWNINAVCLVIALGIGLASGAVLGSFGNRRLTQATIEAILSAYLTQ